MQQNLKQVADALEALAAALRSLAPAETTPPQTEPAPATPAPKEPTTTGKKISIEDVRALLSSKMDEGKRQGVKELLMRYGTGRLSGVKPEDYAALMAEAEVL